MPAKTMRTTPRKTPCGEGTKTGSFPGEAPQATQWPVQPLRGCFGTSRPSVRSQGSRLKSPLQMLKSNFLVNWYQLWKKEKAGRQAGRQRERERERCGLDDPFFSFCVYQHWISHLPFSLLESAMRASWLFAILFRKWCSLSKSLEDSIFGKVCLNSSVFLLYFLKKNQQAFHPWDDTCTLHKCTAFDSTFEACFLLGKYLLRT